MGTSTNLQTSILIKNQPFNPAAGKQELKLL